MALPIVTKSLDLALKSEVMHRILSFVIRSRNASPDLRLCLSGVLGQELPEATELELILVDNESDDDSVEVASEFGALIVPISAQEFSWGRALNRGISRAHGELVVILSADAQPVDSHWLSEMIKPFTDSTVGAVYGRQDPRPNAPIDERARLLRTFGDTSRLMRPGDDGILAAEGGMIVSNACAAIRHRCWVELRYNENMQGAEERVWTASILSRGYSVCYQASARVYHSHRDTIKRFVWREWELFYERTLAITGRRPTIWRSLWTAGALAKRRVNNCFRVSGYPSVKIEGMLRLPVELSLFLIVDFLCRAERIRRQMRPLFWG